MRCAHAKAQISAAAMDELAPGARAALTAHQAGCAACADAERAARALRRLLPEALPAAPEAPTFAALSPAFDAALAARAAARSWRFWPRLFDRLWPGLPAVALGAAAGLLLGVALARGVASPPAALGPGFDRMLLGAAFAGLGGPGGVP